MTDYKAELTAALEQLRECDEWRAGAQKRERALSNENARLTEQLAMARTEAKDVQSFRDSDKRDAQQIMFGMKLAIHAMVEGMKGVK